MAVLYLVPMSPGRDSCTGSSPTSGPGDGSTSPPQPLQTPLTSSHTVITHIHVLKLMEFQVSARYLNHAWPDLFLHVRHLDRRFVPQLVRQTQLHLDSFMHQVLQGGHGLTGPLCNKQTLTPLLLVLGRLFHTLHLGVSEAARPLGMNVVLQDTLADVVHGFSQTSFPAGRRWRTFTQH